MDLQAYGKACGDEAESDLRRSLLSVGRWRKRLARTNTNSARACLRALAKTPATYGRSLRNITSAQAAVALARARFRGPSGANTKSRVFKAKKSFLGGVAVRSEPENRLFVAHHREATTTFTRSRRAVSRFGPRCSDD